MKTIATHSGMYHADDVFAVATLLMVYPDAEVIRTRDMEKIQEAEIAVDVGME
ncbi:MAG: MYG1 family protein, partial [Parcubacteria group bacterium]